MTERRLDIVMDHLHTLNDLTPKIRCNGRGGVDPTLVFGLDTKLFSDPSQLVPDGSHNDEVQTVTVWRGTSIVHPPSCACQEYHDHPQPGDQANNDGPALNEALLTSALAALPKESVWRVKGFVGLASLDSRSPKLFIVNWAFGRFDLTQAVTGRGESQDSSPGSERNVLLTVMGERGEMRRYATKFAKDIGAVVR